MQYKWDGSSARRMKYLDISYWTSISEHGMMLIHRSNCGSMSYSNRRGWYSDSTDDSSIMERVTTIGRWWHWFQFGWIGARTLDSSQKKKINLNMAGRPRRTKKMILALLRRGGKMLLGAWCVLCVARCVCYVLCVIVPLFTTTPRVITRNMSNR